MSRTIYSLLVFVVFPILSYTQWIEQVSGVDVDLTDVFFINQNTGAGLLVIVHL